MLQVQEACDDGNNISGDGCESDCTFTVNIDWVVVRQATSPLDCSSIFNMAWRADGNVATVGNSKFGGNYALHVATWEADNGDVLAEHFGDSFVSSATAPRLDAQPDGDLLVAFMTAQMSPNTTTGTAWRFGPNLELEWMKTAAQLGVLPTTQFRGVLGKPDGGMLLAYNGYLSDFDAQTQLLQSEHLSMAALDIAMIGDRPWALGVKLMMNAFAGVLRIYDLPNFSLVKQTAWQIDQADDSGPWQIENRGNHIVVGGMNPTPTVWRLDDAGEIVATQVITQLGFLTKSSPGLGVSSDGTVAFTTLGRAMAVDVDGTLLWHLPASAIDMGVYFRDALVDDEGHVYLGGYDASNVNCFEAVLARVSW